MHMEVADVDLQLFGSARSPPYHRHHAVGRHRPDTSTEELQKGNIPIIDADPSRYPFRYSGSEIPIYPLTR